VILIRNPGRQRQGLRVRPPAIIVGTHAASVLERLSSFLMRCVIRTSEPLAAIDFQVLFRRLVPGGNSLGRRERVALPC